MHYVLLLILALTLPLGWGWLVNWMIERFWPPRSAAGPASSPRDPNTRTPVDYQI